jgi:hypothetical protein
MDTASENILCLKVLEIVEGADGSDIYVTPYMFAEVYADMLEGKKPFSTRTPEIKYDFNSPEFRNRRINCCVTDGYIHTYAIPRGKDIEAMAKELEYIITVIGKKEMFLGGRKAKLIQGCEDNPYVNGIALYLCEIPAGTEYASGLDDTHHLPGYVSREIMFKEKLAEWREEPLKKLSDIMESLFGNKNHG